MKSQKSKIKSQRLELRISRLEVEHVTELANISITQKEHEKYSKELSEVINYNMSHLEKINTKNVKPTAHATGETSITRRDETEPGLSQEDALKNAPNTHNKFFKVDHIFGED